MCDASPKVTLGGGQAADFVGQHVHQGGLRVRTPVGQDALEMIPYAFIRIQFGGIGGERHKMEAAGASKEFLHRIAAMDIAVIQENDKLAAHLAQ